jgi:hypothetical protein
VSEKSVSFSFSFSFSRSRSWPSLHQSIGRAGALRQAVSRTGVGFPGGPFLSVQGEANPAAKQPCGQGIFFQAQFFLLSLGYWVVQTVSS